MKCERIEMKREKERTWKGRREEEKVDYKG